MALRPPRPPRGMRRRSRRCRCVEDGLPALLTAHGTNGLAQRPTRPRAPQLREVSILQLQKRISDSEAKLKIQQSLYEAVRSDRNLYSKSLIEAQEEIAEMKRKFKIMNHQIDQLKEEIHSKDKVFPRTVRILDSHRQAQLCDEAHRVRLHVAWSSHMCGSHRARALMLIYRAWSRSTLITSRSRKRRKCYASTLQSSKRWSPRMKSTSRNSRQRQRDSMRYTSCPPQSRTSLSLSHQRSTCSIPHLPASSLPFLVH